MRFALALLLVVCLGCGGATSNSAPPADAQPETGSCAAVAGLGCACGAASGTWRCVGETPVCACAALDAAVDVLAMPDVTEEPGADPAACLGPCAVSADCATACGVSATDPSIYCCVEGRCVASRRACADLPRDARLCASGEWSPVCSRAADCPFLCGEGWSCRRPATGIARCEPLTAPSDGGSDVVRFDAADASRDASDVPRDLPCTGTMCSGRCVDTARDPSNCGACGVGCPPAANAAPACATSTCGLVCGTGFADCDRRASNGCEADLSTPAYCGTCAVMCREHVGCSAGACAGCVEHFGDCDGLSANGCEADLRFDAFNCGTCGRRCSGSCYASVCR